MPRLAAATFLLAAVVSALLGRVECFVALRISMIPTNRNVAAVEVSSCLFSAGPSASRTSATELPDSLEDAAERAAQATAEFVSQAGPLARCRVDFDTSVGDETYTLLKSSTEFMQNFVSACCYGMIPGLQRERQAEMMRAIQAKAELRSLAQEKSDSEMDADPRVSELLSVIASKGRTSTSTDWKGPVCRVYFPDEGSAALARRDWLSPDNPKVPLACVRFSSCSGIQLADIANDGLIFFFCPKASESEYVEKMLAQSEANCPNLLLSCFVNPNLVDMGVTGFGMAGRLLRERLIEPLQYTYYLRTLPWGALTRIWPLSFSLWQEDAASDGGYKLLKTMDRLPSNQEVEDIYDIAQGNMSERQSGGLLDQLGDFMQGMMRL